MSKIPSDNKTNKIRKSPKTLNQDDNINNILDCEINSSIDDNEYNDDKEDNNYKEYNENNNYNNNNFNEVNNHIANNNKKDTDNIIKINKIYKRTNNGKEDLFEFQVNTLIINKSLNIIEFN